MTKQLPGTETPTRKRKRERKPLSWIPLFLAELAAGGTVRGSIRAAGIATQTAYNTRDRHPEFAAAWDEALDSAQANDGRMLAICTAGLRPSVPDGAPDSAPAKGLAKASSTHWRPCFFAALAETSNMAVATARANVAVATIYKLRREDAGFAEQWQAALHEGYDNLEMELLGHLRNPQPGRRMDVTSALRLLAAHRETVERRRALNEEEDEQALLESIDRFIDDMRERRAANTAVLAETEAETETGPETDDGAE